MAGGTGEIEMDTAALTRAAGDLEDAGGRLTSLSSDAGSVRVSASAFGAMNSFLAGPIELAASRTTELIGAAGAVVSALAAGARAAAADWEQYEDDTAQTFSAAQADLAGAQDIL